MEWLSILKDGNTQWVILSTLLLGIASGVMGSFALLRKQSLIGDAVAHSALPGICLAFMIMGEKDFFGLLVGAAVTGLIAAYLIQAVTRTSKIKEDTAICLFLSVFFGLGIVLLTKVAQMPSGNQSGLDHFIFGQAASLVGKDVRLMGGTAFVLILVITVFFKEFKLITFDAQFAKGVGLPVQRLNFLFLSLLVITVIVGIQAVGVILMAALLITPAISARYWTDSLHRMVAIAGVFGGVSGVVGTIISAMGKGLSTGPFIVLTASAIFVISILFAPSKGMISKGMERRRNDRILLRRSLLKASLGGGCRISEMHVRLGTNERKMSEAIHHCMHSGWLYSDGGEIVLTEQGRLQATHILYADELRELKEMYPAEMAAYDEGWLEEAAGQTPSDENLMVLIQERKDVYNLHPYMLKGVRGQ
ncbi:metal ABC transporter permease [Rossellomorea marisflavi]|uniref:metal ABC transporter permease n=1 Tax=Rossellomorea marisflavi TaxID=189381 RepID=UPI0009E7BB62|nr:metal ABC transporter permease [Rossellomorea marisflavi]MDW4527085.1 metal ABC transporter permease [Rossellomorea marisflavi]